MPSEPTLLAFDTSAAHCAAALLSGGRVIVLRHEDMTRGQAERLMPLLEEVLAEGGTSWKSLDALAVGVGPGNFTGIRIAVSAARGLALGLGVPAYGVDGFEARRQVQPGTAVAIPAPREQIYLSRPGAEPVLCDRAEAEAANGPFPPEPTAAALAEAIARCAARRWPGEPPSPAPLYIRTADAAPSRDLPPVLLD